MWLCYYYAAMIYSFTFFLMNVLCKDTFFFTNFQMFFVFLIVEFHHSLLG
jgi:hypothetical protein